MGKRGQSKIQRIVSALLPCRPEKIYLFGSCALGEDDELSDVDLVVIMRTDLPFLSRLRHVGRLLPPEVGGVDLLVYTPEEFSTMAKEGNAFAEMIMEDSRVVYER